MKKLYAVIGLASTLLGSSSYASTVTLTEVGGNDNGGGLFQAVTSDNGTFDTFCISIDTTFGPGTQYNYIASSTLAVTGGIPPGSPYIAEGTAYIYNQFLHNNPNYAGVANANAVQATIWYLQGLLGGSDGYVDPENGQDLSVTDGLTTILNQVEHDSGMSLAKLQADGKGAYGVQAMNLYDSDGGIYQPQLIAVPEPTTMISGALLLLPFGASTIRILRKNRAA